MAKQKWNVKNGQVIYGKEEFRLYILYDLKFRQNFVMEICLLRREREGGDIRRQLMMIQWLNQWRHDCKTAFSSRGKNILHHWKNILAHDDVFWLSQKSETHLTRKKIDKSERRDTRFLVKPRDLSFTKVPMHPRSQALCRDVTV